MPTISELLNRSRKELLDLSTRNRLLSIPVNSKSARIVEVHDELSEHVFRLLVTEKKSLSFLPGKPSRKQADLNFETKEEESEETGLPQPDDEVDEKTGIAKRHIDARLQTSLTPEGLQSRLLNLFYDAHTMIEEQGVNILYVALGHLKWFEANHSDTPRYAPLILIPVKMERKTASERFHISWDEEDLEENLSLRAKFKTDFNIELPDFPEDDDLNIVKYFESVRRVIASAPGWEVIPNGITLGFFSFAKFLMYRDLDPANWPSEEMLLGHSFITGLLQDGFPHAEPLFSEDCHIDDVISVANLDHVVDADCSQTIAIEYVRQGKSLVIQGPPGTGKSQSITNIISTAVLEGKRVLFIAEKLAALEVVKRRLEHEGLGSLCLELHSNKSNKRAVIEEIANTWKLGRPSQLNLENKLLKLESKRDLLNKHVKELHVVHNPSGVTPYFVLGVLSKLCDKNKDVSALTFLDAEKWTKENCSEYRRLVQEMVSRIEAIGQPSLHPWRGVGVETVLSIDLPPLEKNIQSVAEKLAKLTETTDKLSTQLERHSPTTIEEINKQKTLSEFVLKAPVIDKNALCNSIWESGMGSLRELLNKGMEFEKVVKEIGHKATEATWKDDFTNARIEIAKHGKTLIRFLVPAYRNSIKHVRNLLKVKITASYKDKLSIIDKVIIGQKAYQAIQQGEGIARAAFGNLWKNENTDWENIEAIINWVSEEAKVGLDITFHNTFAKVDENTIAKTLEQINQRQLDFRQEAESLFSTLKLDIAYAFGVPSLDLISLDLLGERFSTWLSQIEALSRWNNYYIRAKKAREVNLAELVTRLENGEIKPECAIDCFDRIYYGQLLRAFIKEKPQLAQFDGVLHGQCVEEFKELDKERLLLAKYRTLLKHHESMPPSSGGIGPAGIVKSEVERKRGHRTVRKLLKDAGTVVQAIKPVFMMSPLSVAQFLEPGAVDFDLLVIDEASQVQPVDALGAIARCKQIVVVGDSKQLPPTRFFNRLTSDSSEEDEDQETLGVAEAKDIESILGLCTARGIPSSMLRWHYRSRHHSLIAVSNHEFYDNELFIVPSPYSTSSTLGVKFHHIADGVFDSGKTGTNRVEAKAICRAIIEHARKNPNLTLGVAAFSVKQRQAILDELELLRRECPDTEPFFNNHLHEPFFVKNLENVQGDERDVIFISVGYGKDVHGWMAMRFGPLSNEGGERRLNVLISRAKQRCEVFSSITADDIDLERAGGRGVMALKVFLSFAKTGLLSISKRTGKEEQSPFEEAVCKAIEGLNYEVHTQVGIAGFFIDLAVLDKDGSGRYLLGIECDGASYHSSRSARDRDRLRQAVLEDHGWLIHRIWSIDWFQRPQEQLRKVAESIEKAKIALSEVKEQAPEVSVTIEFDSGEVISRDTSFKVKDEEFAIPYKEADFSVPKTLEPHEVSKKEMANIIYRIVEEESPIHEDEIVVRIRSLWGLSRAGNRIQDAVASGIRSLLVSRRCTREDGCLQIPDKDISIRNRSNVSSNSLRKPEMIPPQEIRAAILKLIDAYHGSTRQEIPLAVARLFGFKTTSSQLKDVIDSQVAKMLKKEMIVSDEGMLKRVN
jgi:very-short-patch-repair endonuclease